jgi:hypothetical protein
MKPIMVVGIALIVIGLLALAYQRVTYTTREEVVEVGPLQVSAEERGSPPECVRVTGVLHSNGRYSRYTSTLCESQTPDG